MPTWDSKTYLRFNEERTRAASDLAARIQIDGPRQIVDLGCGPGNSTAVLCRRWPNATVVGIDHSEEMLQRARNDYPKQSWQLGDVQHWSPTAPVDLVFSNAALQWLTAHDVVVPAWFSHVRSGGALAVQIPSVRFGAIRSLIDEVAMDDRWSERLATARSILNIEAPEHYFDLLSGSASRIDLWESIYYHVLPSLDHIVEWMKGTGLRPYLELLSGDDERELFLNLLRERVQGTYEVRSNGSVLFEFRRLFFIAYKL